MSETRTITLISGGARGIGAAIAARLATSGQRVIAAGAEFVADGG